MLRRLQKGVKYALRLRKDHHCVHVEGPPFEGFYTRIQGHDRSTLAIVFCWVKDAKIRPNFLHVSYTPIASNSPIKHFKVEIFPESLEKILLSDHEADKKTIGAERAESFGDNRDLLQPFCLRIPPLRTKDTHAHSSDTNATQRQTRSEDAEVTQMGARRGDTDATHMQAHSGDADADATQMRARRGDADAVPLRSDGATSAADVLAMTSGEYVIGKHAQRYVVRFPHPEDGAQMHLEVDLTDRCAWNEPHNSDSVEQVGSEKKEEKEVIRAGMGSPADFLAGPEGGLVRLNKLLPLHWYVFSTRSKAKYTLSRDGHEILRNEGWAHQEKNWGNSFPTGWIWSHGVSPDAATYFSLAGGSILGISAYLIGFRSKKFVWDFRPPITMSLFPFFTRVTRDSRKGKLDISVRDLFRKLEISVNTSPDTYMPLACPLSHGHEPDYAVESFASKAEIRAFTRTRPWGAWLLAESHQIGEAALEFGGDYSHHTKERKKEE